MFEMRSSGRDTDDDCISYVDMTIRNNNDLTLTQMLAYFMQMMHKCGYHDESWNSVIDNILEWRAKDPDDWVTNFYCNVI